MVPATLETAMEKEAQNDPKTSIGSARSWQSLIATVKKPLLWSRFRWGFPSPEGRIPGEESVSFLLVNAWRRTRLTTSQHSQQHRKQDF